MLPPGLSWRKKSAAASNPGLRLFLIRMNFEKPRCLAGLHHGSDKIQDKSSSIKMFLY